MKTTGARNEWFEANAGALEAVRNAYSQGNLTLYVGAGVSAENGLPTWNQLVLGMYFAAVQGDWKHLWRPFPNYLYAIAEWQLERRHEPLEITAQKIRQYYTQATEFLSDLRDTLYAGGNFNGSAADIRGANLLLKAIEDLCRLTTTHGSGIRSIVSYNYDNLVERVIEGSPCHFTPVWKSSQPLNDDEHPIYHVHGYIPWLGTGSAPEEIVFTEEQYHSAANDPYSWSNLCQLQAMSSSVGLMIGISLTDPNMRRLLSALKKTPLRKHNYALLRRPKWPEPNRQEFETIHEKANQYAAKFERSGIKTERKRMDQILQIIAAVNENERAAHTRMLEDLGITPMWYEEHAELPSVLRRVSNPL